MRYVKPLAAAQFRFSELPALFTAQESMSAADIFSKLDEHVIGQSKAKRVLAVAFRNRYRRQRLSPELQAEVIPKNILMVGPTGSGKTELARRLAALTAAPFIKVEATHYTEVGYYGKDVDSIIGDLVQLTEAKIAGQLATLGAALPQQLTAFADLLVLDLLLGPNCTDKALRRKKLSDVERGEYDAREVRVPAAIFSHRAAFESIDNFLAELRGLGTAVFDDCQTGAQYMTVADFRNSVLARFGEQLERRFDVRGMAIRRVEDHGVVFLDEIDKIATNKEAPHGARGPSTDGVQRDLLPLMEGTVVALRRGRVNTRNILFVCAGAFSSSKPADLLPELLGRLPVHVTLDTLRKKDYESILTRVKYNLPLQYEQLLAVDGVRLSFEPEAIARLAEIAEELNYSVENLGARRLMSLLEGVLEEASFGAQGGGDARDLVVTAEYVDQRLQEHTKKVNYRNYLL